MHEVKSKWITFKHAIMNFDMQNELYKEKLGIVVSRCPGGEVLSVGI